MELLRAEVVRLAAANAAQHDALEVRVHLVHASKRKKA
jgi:hypothetical protein